MDEIPPIQRKTIQKPINQPILTWTLFCFVSQQVQFEDVLNEAPGLKTFDFVWLCSRECYGFFHGLCYGLITLFLAPFIALAWGCSFAFTAFEHIWCLTPIEKNVYICCGTCFKNCFKYLFDCFITPCTSACGGIFVVFHTDSPQTTVVRPKARQTKTASRDKKSEDEDVEPMDETKAFLAVPVVLRESSYVTNHKDNAMKSIQRQMNMFQWNTHKVHLELLGSFGYISRKKLSRLPHKIKL